MNNVKLAIIGCGGIARNQHGKHFSDMDDVDIVACCDLGKDAAEQLATLYNVPHVYTDYKKLLKQETDLDAVAVCTPNSTHAPVSIAALKKGHHVLVEKPMAMTPAQGKRMIRQAEASGKILMVAQHHRFSGPAVMLKEIVDSGRLGDIYYARALSIRRRGVPSWGVFGRKDLQGGGALIDIGVHIIDLTMHLMGMPKPVAVSGKVYHTIGNQPGHHGSFGQWDWTTYDVEDFAVALVRLDNGATMLCESAFCVNLEADRFACHLAGDKGGASTDPLNVVVEESGYMMDCTPQHVPRVASPHGAEDRAFIDAIKADAPSPVPGAQALQTLRIIEAIYKSSESGKEVKLR